MNAGHVYGYFCTIPLETAMNLGHLKILVVGILLLSSQSFAKESNVFSQKFEEWFAIQAEAEKKGIEVLEFQKSHALDQHQENIYRQIGFRQQTYFAMSARAQNLQAQIENEFSKLTPAKQEQTYVDLIKKGYFDRASKECIEPIAHFFLNRFDEASDITKYLTAYTQPFENIQIDPYQRAVLSSCLRIVETIDQKEQLLGISFDKRLRVSQKFYADCNSNLHLMIKFPSSQNQEGKFQINDDMLDYLLTNSPLTLVMVDANEETPEKVLEEMGGQFSKSYYEHLRFKLRSRAQDIQKASIYAQRMVEESSKACHDEEANSILVQ